METDYQKIDQIWQRVAPSLNPYPEARAEQEKRIALSGTPEPTDDAETVQGFLREEMADAETYRALSCAAGAPRRLMCRLAGEEAEHARMLRAAYYLITGACYRVTVVLPPQPKLLWCDRLRERYHEETHGSADYARAAAQTGDACLKRLFQELSEAECRHAELLRKELSRMM